ncbi:MAG: DNA polymerase III subunit delta [Flavobacteriia bacterium]|nr:DNA polymerase III subunit delta [Flavobacteriia bacterium]
MEYQKILSDIQQKKIAPIYLLHGEEPFFIDILSKEIQKHTLEDHERDFNESVVYGKDADIASVLSFAKGYPMMAEKKLVIIREAQDVKDKDYDLIEKYIHNFNESSVFVFAFKYKKLDSRIRLYKLFKEKGIVYLSEKIRDYQLPSWINSYLKNKKYRISEKAAVLLADFLGNDLSKIVNELEKLQLLIPPQSEINESDIEKNIGISKDYNIFELNNAILEKNIIKALKIVDYFAHNPKAASILALIPTLYNSFSKLMKIHSNPHQSNEYYAQNFGGSPYQIKELRKSEMYYSPRKIAENIAVLLEYDLKAKGVENVSFSESDLMKEMVFKLIPL